MGNSIDKVIEGLFVGRFLGANEKEKLLEKGITHVLAIHDTAEARHSEVFEYKCIKISDISSSDLMPYFKMPYFKECVDFIHTARLKSGRVYAHCASGSSRSVTIVVMYIMTVSSLNFEESLMLVKHCREVANPNSGFRMQLKKYSEETLAMERKRIEEQFPDTKKLNDEQSLQKLLTEAHKPKPLDSEHKDNQVKPKQQWHLV